MGHGGQWLKKLCSARGFLHLVFRTWPQGVAAVPEAHSLFPWMVEEAGSTLEAQADWVLLSLCSVLESHMPVNLTVVSFCMSCFSFAAFKIFPLSLGFNNLTVMYLAMDFFEFIGSSLSFLDSIILSFIRFGKFLCFIPIFFVSPFLSSEIPVMHVLVYLIEKKT